MALPGVGPYVAENLLKFLGRPRGLALDSWMRAKYARLHHGGRRVSDRTIARRYARLGEWAGVARVARPDARLVRGGCALACLGLADLTESGRERAFRLAVGAIAALALAVRLAHLTAVLAPPFGDVLVQDARVYHETARRLLGQLPPLAEPGPSFMNVGYPWFLAVIARVLGPAPRVALLVQALLGAVACALLALAGRGFTGSRRAGLLAGGGALLAAPVLFYDGLLLTPSPTFAFLSATLWLLSCHRRRPSVRTACAVGAALALPILLRANAVLFVPVAAAAVVHAAPPGVRLRGALALAAAALCLPALVVLRVGLVHGAWVPLSANAGMNLWVGNHRGATGVYVAAPFLGDGGAEAEETAYRDEARRRAGDPWMTLAESSAFWRTEAAREVAADGLDALRRFFRKAGLFFTGFEVKTNYSLEFVERRSPILRMLPLRFGALAAAGMAGIALLLAGRRAGGVLLLAWTAASWLTCVVFFVSGEYRHAATPALLVGLGALASEARRSSGSPGWRRSPSSPRSPLRRRGPARSFRSSSPPPWTCARTCAASSTLHPARRPWPPATSRGRWR